MKKNVFLLIGVMAALSACEKNFVEVDDSAMYEDDEHRVMTFSVEGDFGSAGFTRGALSADGKAMTDLWVLDYVDGQLVQQKHQTADDEDFGEPTMALEYGSHHVYFIASRGEGATLSTSGHKISWTKVLDTFWKDYNVNVTSATSASQNVTLGRVATKLQVAINDEIPEGTATVELTPATWYYGLDYMSGEACDPLPSETRIINIPSSYIGTTGRVTASIYGISNAAEWTTNVSVTARDGDDDVLGQVSIAGAPFKANRVTSYAGSLFSSGGDFSITLNDTWSDAYNGEW